MDPSTPAAARPPRAILVAGPNGAGKTTAAPRLLRGGMGVEEFVNADLIAAGLSAFRPESVGLQAGRLFRKRLSELAAARADFAFETTLASKSFAPWLRQLREDEGYEAVLLFLWVASPEQCLSRVRQRVLQGGHAIPPEVVRRRWERGIANFPLYRAVVDRWGILDNTHGLCDPVASGGIGAVVDIHAPSTYLKITRGRD